MKHITDLGDNRWKLTITDDANAGKVLSVFRGTKDEIIAKLADSQMNASRRISELRGNGNGHAAAATAPQPMTAAERMQTVADLANPATVEKGVTRVLESVIGPVQELRQDREEDRAARLERAAVEAARKFADSTPEWYPSEYNKERLVRYLQTQGMDPASEQSYIQAFEDLSAAELLQSPPQAQPATDETTTGERNVPPPTQPPTPTRFSTSIRQSDISGSPPRPTTRLKYTREQLAGMSAATYKRLLTSDPDLVRCVDYYAQQDAKKRKAG